MVSISDTVVGYKAVTSVKERLRRVHLSIGLEYRTPRDMKEVLQNDENIRRAAMMPLCMSGKIEPGDISTRY